MSTLENIKVIRNAGRESSFGHQEIITKGSTRMTKETAMVK